MKVVRIIARLNVGGPARHVAWVTAGLRRAGYESLLVAGRVPPGEDDMSYFAAQQGIEPLIIPEMSREMSPQDVITIWKLYRLFKRERPDLVHTHTAKAGTVGRVAGLLYRWFTPTALIGRPRRCRFVHTYHGHIFHSYYGALKTRVFLLIERVLARLATDRIVVISAQQYREIHEAFGVGRREQFAIVPLGLDLSVFGEWRERRAIVRREWRMAEDDLLIGIVGRLTEIKNHRLFLQAAALLRERRRSGDAIKKTEGRRVRFVIVGDGHLRAELEEQARALDLGEVITFAGLRDDPENFYPALDIVALTSLNEGTPLTLIEAMANARPIIASAVGGVIDLLGEVMSIDRQATQSFGESFVKGWQVRERGIAVAPNDAQAFSCGLEYLIGREDVRRVLGERGREFVEGSYSKERLLEGLDEVYRKLLQPEQEAKAVVAAPLGATGTPADSRPLRTTVRLKGD